VIAVPFITLSLLTCSFVQTVKRILQYIFKQGDLDKFDVIMRERWIRGPLTVLQAERMLSYLKVRSHMQY